MADHVRGGERDKDNADFMQVITDHQFYCVSQNWSAPQQKAVLERLVGLCDSTQVRHLMQVIRPQSQRDFISLLPREVGPVTTRHASGCYVAEILVCCRSR